MSKIRVYDLVKTINNINGTEMKNNELIASLNENGIEVNCFTVDDKDRAEELASWGIDYITSNILE